MEIYPMLTGSQLRQYLHISTRKLKYLMDHDYIPHEDTGQATYRYRVRWEDAVEFKRRMEEEPGFLGELAGQFVVISTAVSIVTIFLWVLFFKTMGMI